MYFTDLLPVGIFTLPKYYQLKHWYFWKDNIAICCTQKKGFTLMDLHIHNFKMMRQGR